jgi:hypothetical protein
MYREKILYLEDNTNGLYYYHNGRIYNATTLALTTKNPNKINLVEVLNLDENITAPEEFTSHPVFIKTLNMMTVLTTNGENNIEINYVQSFDLDSSIEINGNPFNNSDPVIEIVKFKIPSYHSNESGSLILNTTYHAEFHNMWYQKLLELKKDGKGLDQLDLTPLIDPEIEEEEQRYIKSKKGYKK